MTVPAGSSHASAGRSAPPPLLAVAHGSRDPASARLLEVLAANVADLIPEIDVHLAYIENVAPLLTDVMPDVPDAVVVPLLLSRGTHVLRDLPEGAARPLGPDPVLTEVLLDRLRTAGVVAETPLVLAATGSATTAGQDDVRAQAALLADAWGAPVTASFVTAARPTVTEARAAAGPEAVVVSYFLAPGLLPDVAAAATLPLADHPRVAELVVSRYRSMLADAQD